MKIDDHFVQPAVSVKQALKQLDLVTVKVLIVVDEAHHMLGTLTDGDVRRFILQGRNLDETIQDVFQKNPLFLKASFFSIDIARIMIIENKIGLLPLLDDENRVIDCITRDMVYKDYWQKPAPGSELNLPVVIMAGGKGTRMEPFTKILPKPLIPIGETPIIEMIMDEFHKQGAKEYFVTVNYKAEMIEAYFKNEHKDYTINYVKEDDFYGTAGCLRLLIGRLHGTFIVSNCDVLVKANYEEVLRLHRENEADITILSSFQHYKIPYGIIRFKEGGTVTQIEEKPEFSFPINTGIYILEGKLLSTIPEKQMFHMTDMINQVLAEGGKVMTYPVNENEYVDIGQWEEYKKAMDKLQILTG